MGVLLCGYGVGGKWISTCKEYTLYAGIRGFCRCFGFGCGFRWRGKVGWLVMGGDMVGAFGVQLSFLVQEGR